MQYMSSVSSLGLPLQCIMVIFFMCYDISGGLLSAVSFTLVGPLFSFRPTRMLLKRAPRTIVTQFLAPVFVLVLLWLSGRPRSRLPVSCSSIEAELRALAATIRELIWLRWILQDLGVSIPLPHLFIVTVLEPFRLLLIRSSIS